jgi:NTE family protein
VLINPRLGSIGWFDFHRGKDAIHLGAEAAERSLDSINEAIAALSQTTSYNGNGGGK